MMPRITTSEPFTAAPIAAPPPNCANCSWPAIIAAVAVGAPGMSWMVASRPFFWKIPVSAAIYSAQKPGVLTLKATLIFVPPMAPEAGATADGLAEAAALAGAGFAEAAALALAAALGLAGALDGAAGAAPPQAASSEPRATTNANLFTVDTPSNP